MTAPVLPSGPASLSIGTMAGLFRNAVSSYKFLWVLSILEILSDGKFAARPIPVRLALFHMLNIAREPLDRFRLVFGNPEHDHVRQHLNTARERRGLFEREYTGEEMMDAYKLLPRAVYVPMSAAGAAPYRLLTPFLSGVRFNKTAIQEAARLAFDREDSPILYRFSENGESIVIHADWERYLLENFEVVRGWVMWHWVRFLEQHNRNTPAIAAKLDGVSRGNLQKHRELWEIVMMRAQKPLRCIYSGRVVSPDDYSLDHYLPWEFVCHDSFWNLVPIPQGVNSSKNDNLPHERHMDKLVAMHQTAIAAYHARRDDLRKKYERIMSSYATDLRVDAHESVPDNAALAEAYERVVPASIAFAKGQGFKDGWTL